MFIVQQNKRRCSVAKQQDNRMKNSFLKNPRDQGIRNLKFDNVRYKIGNEKICGFKIKGEQVRYEAS